MHIINAGGLSVTPPPQLSTAESNSVCFCNDATYNVLNSDFNKEETIDLALLQNKSRQLVINCDLTRNVINS